MVVSIALAFVIFTVFFAVFYRAEKRRRAKPPQERSAVSPAIKWGTILTLGNIIIVALASIINGFTAAGILLVALGLPSLAFVAIGERRRRERERQQPGGSSEAR